MQLAQEKVSQAVPGERDWVHAKFQLSRSNALYNTDQALLHIGEALAAAEKLDDRNLVAAGNCIKAMIVSDMQTRADGQKVFEQAALDERASAIEELWFCEADCYFGPSDESDAKWARFESAVRACDDELLRAGLMLSIVHRQARSPDGISEIIDEAVGYANEAGVDSFMVELDLLKLLDGMVRGNQAEGPGERMRGIADRAHACGAIHTQTTAVAMMVAMAPVLDLEAVDLARTLIGSLPPL